MLKQLPTSVKQKVVARETNAWRNGFQVNLKMPPRLDRLQVLAVVGEALRLRLRDDPRRPKLPQ